MYLANEQSEKIARDVLDKHTAAQNGR